jgi:hypothetical protein
MSGRVNIYDLHLNSIKKTQFHTYIIFKTNSNDILSVLKYLLFKISIIYFRQANKKKMNNSLNDFDFTDGEIKEQLELLGKNLNFNF